MTGQHDTDGLLAAVADDTATARELLDDAAARLGKYSETVPVSSYAQTAAAIATGYAQLANIGVQVASNAGAAAQNERIFELQSAVADAHRAMEARMRAEQAEIEARAAKLAELDVATLAASGRREERAVAEARPHDDELVPVPCPRCEGCGQLADTDDREPWSAWENLPPGSDLAVKAGLVKPVPCDQCDGKKTVLRPDGRR